ncbi:hypothetical protein [Facilibium subflavum]|uniref:hypothetical protein n=1 Tax=Facilibium subflavum TaxID=2219058 RepID=UPI000E64ADEA|nr:hypothetical protein [Facilibium subflavum]
MKAYITTEFRAHLAEALKRAKKDGVYNKKGDEFTIMPSKKTSSPFDKVKGINLKSVDKNEIIEAISESRDRYQWLGNNKENASKD